MHFHTLEGSLKDERAIGAKNRKAGSQLSLDTELKRELKDGQSGLFVCLFVCFGRGVACVLRMVVW